MVKIELTYLPKSAGAMAPSATPETTPLNFAQEVGELCSDKTIATLTPEIDEKTSQNMLLWYLCTTKTKHFFAGLALHLRKKNDSLPHCSQPLLETALLA